MNKFKAKKDDVGRILYKYLLKICDNVPKSRIERILEKKILRLMELEQMINNINCN